MPPGNPTYVQINQTARGFDNLTTSAQKATGALKQAVAGNQSFLGGLKNTVAELATFKGVMTGVFSMFTLSAWRSGFEVMGRLQEAGNQVARSWGQMENAAKMAGEVARLANNLGVEYERAGAAMVAASKNYAQINLTNEEFLAATRNAAKFGEATGMGAEQGAAMMSKLIGVAKLTPEQVGMIQEEFIGLQQTIGMTGEEMAALADGITPVIEQVKTLGATKRDIEGLVKATSELTLGFAAMGRSTQDATKFIDRMLDPGRLSENIVLFSQLGVSVSEAMSAMQGDDPGGFLSTLTDKLPELGERIMAMGPMAGDMFARQLGLTYREAVQFTKMSSAEAKARAEELEKKRQAEEKFQKQLAQTVQTWQRALIGLTQAFDQIRMKFAQVLGGDTFMTFQRAILDTADMVINFLKDINIKEIMQTMLIVIHGAIKAFTNVLKPLGEAIGNAVVQMKLRELGTQVAELMKTIGSWVGDFVKKYLPPFLDMVTKLVNKLNDFLKSLGPKGKLATLAGVFMGGSFLKGAFTGEGMGGAILGPLVAKLTGGLFGAKLGTQQNPMYTREVGGIFGFIKGIFDFIKTIVKFIGMLILLKGVVALLQKLNINIPFLSDNKEEAVKEVPKGMGITPGGGGAGGPGGKGLGPTVISAKNLSGPSSWMDSIKDFKPTAPQKIDSEVIAKQMSDVIASISTPGGGGKTVGGGSPAAQTGLIEDFKNLVRSTQTYKDAMESTRYEYYKQKDVMGDMTKEQYAFRKSLLDTGVAFGFSINDIADGLDSLLIKLGQLWDSIGAYIEKKWDGFMSYLRGKYNAFMAKLSATGGEMWEKIKQMGKDAWEYIKSIFTVDYWKGVAESVKNWFINAAKNFAAVASDGLIRLVYRVIKGFQDIMNMVREAIPGADKLFDEFDFAKDAAKTFNATMQARYEADFEDLQNRIREAKAKGPEYYNQMVDSFNSEIKDMQSRFRNQAAFATPENEGFEAYTKNMSKLLNKIEVNTDRGAGAGEASLDELKQIKRNTTPPKKFIDLDSLAIRANESRNVYMTYQTVGTGQ